VTADETIMTLRALANPERAQQMQRYFKTGPGEYGEGDMFLGIPMPEARKVAKRCEKLSLAETVSLLHSPAHEARMVALLILCRQYQRADVSGKERIYGLYLENTRFINNWDLVDLSARDIVGAHLASRNRGRLYSLAASPLIWERRIAVLATFHFLKLDDFSDGLKIARLLLADREDLIHKAVGWMLREIGKQDQSVEEEFLREHYRIMPRTMLRYATERFPEDLRRSYLDGRV
jgi:3-methyladenine DNA glycosylase AlkD